jgi:hypothetical protein
LECSYNYLMTSKRAWNLLSTQVCCDGGIYCFILCVLECFASKDVVKHVWYQSKIRVVSPMEIASAVSPLLTALLALGQLVIRELKISLHELLINTVNGKNMCILYSCTFPMVYLHINQAGTNTILSVRLNKWPQFNCTLLSGGLTPFVGCPPIIFCTCLCVQKA